MRKIIDTLKKVIPKEIWTLARNIWYFLLNLVRGIGPYVRKRSYCGFELYYNRGNDIIRRLNKEPIFEMEMCRCIVTELQSSSEPVFADIGANIGLISSYVLQNVADLNKIYAFEPGPVQRSFLEMTIKRNNLTERVTISPDALGKEIGEMAFFSHDPKHAAKDGLIDTGRSPGARPIKVHVDTLDAWWQRNGRPKMNVVKIDTEGAELWVLQGGRTFLSACRPVIFMEVELRNLRVYPYTYFDILRFFKEISYELATLDGVLITDNNFQEYIENGEDTYMAKPCRDKKLT